MAGNGIDLVVRGRVGGGAGLPHRSGDIAVLNKEIKTYDKLINESYFDVQDYHSFEEKLFLLNFKGMYFLSKSRLKECLIEYENLVELIENSNRKNILKSQEYFFGMNNLLLLQVLNKDYENYNTTLNKIYHQFKGFIEYKPLLFSVTKCYELGIYCEIGNVQKGLQLIPEIDNGLKTYKLVINEVNKLLFYLNIAIIYYFDKNYSKAIYWLNKFLNDYSINKKGVLSNIFYYGNIINIIIHYDAANYDTIDYMYNQCQTNLKKIRKISQFDNLILKFIKKASKKASKKVYTRNIEKKEDFKILKNQLKLLVNNPLEAISLEFFDFFAWIDSHIENKNISEIIQEKKLS